MGLRRDVHQDEVLRLLEKEFPGQSWMIRLPVHGTGNETYQAFSESQSCFIKLGIEIERYRIMDELGLSPRIFSVGRLEDGTTVVVQEWVEGHHPSRKEFCDHLEQFASAVRVTHSCARLRQILPSKPSECFRQAGLETLRHVEKRWMKVRDKVPHSASFVERNIQRLREQIDLFTGGGLVASHNDICNANWLICEDGRVYLIDYESMTLDDPALDLGAILWWYYRPELRARFIAIAGYRDDEALRIRMRVRMAVHNLNIILPRENSYDVFHGEDFEEALVDFRAVMDGQENPQGYGL